MTVLIFIDRLLCCIYAGKRLVFCIGVEKLFLFLGDSEKSELLDANELDSLSYAWGAEGGACALS